VFAERLRNIYENLQTADARAILETHGMYGVDRTAAVSAALPDTSRWALGSRRLDAIAGCPRSPAG